jgi:hypothetical protein
MQGTRDCPNPYHNYDDILLEVRISNYGRVDGFKTCRSLLTRTYDSPPADSTIFPLEYCLFIQKAWKPDLMMGPTQKMHPNPADISWTAALGIELRALAKMF